MTVDHDKLAELKKSRYKVIAFILFLVPYMGITAYIIGSFVSLMVICALEFVKIRESIKLEISVLNWFAKPILASAMAGTAGRFAMDRFFPEPGAVGLVFGVGVLMGMFFAVVFLTGCLSFGDLKRMVKVRG